MMSNPVEIQDMPEEHRLSTAWQRMLRHIAIEVPNVYKSKLFYESINDMAFEVDRLQKTSAGRVMTVGANRDQDVNTVPHSTPARGAEVAGIIRSARESLAWLHSLAQGDRRENHEDLRKCRREVDDAIDLLEDMAVPQRSAEGETR